MFIPAFCNLDGEEALGDLWVGALLGRFFWLLDEFLGTLLFLFFFIFNVLFLVWDSIDWLEMRSGKKRKQTMKRDEKKKKKKEKEKEKKKNGHLKQG
jgi:TRAP-type mannitol/chloroaromatic compound transport system permease small subunit